MELGKQRLRKYIKNERRVKISLKIDSNKHEFLSIWLLLFGFCAAAVMVLVLCCNNSANIPDIVDRTLTAQETDEVIKRNSLLVDYVYLSLMRIFLGKIRFKRLRFIIWAAILA